MRIDITRSIELPDPRRMELYRRNPGLGPRVLFFSGGSALRKTSEELVYYTHNSIHIMTPVDSGGSSAVLREAFRMPAIGDIRNRLMALADRGLTGNPDIFRLFAHRLPADAGQEALEDELACMAEGAHPLVQRVPDPMRKIIRNFLQFFIELSLGEDLPSGFDLRGASIGNLVLTASYLMNRRHFDPAIFIFSKLVNVRGVVRPIVNADLHLVATLANGRTLVGQHLLTGKEVPPIEDRVTEVYLSESRRDPQPTLRVIREKMASLIRSADLICYPMGSFYSSLMANLLLKGVAEAIRRNPCPKIFVPNTSHDPELRDHSLQDQVDVLLDTLKKDAPGRVADGDFLDVILVDERSGGYPGGLDRREMDRRGIMVIDCRLVTMRSQPYIDEKMLVPVLLSLA